MSDYYNYLKKSSGFMPGSPLPEGFESLEQYRQLRLDEIDYITGKLKDLREHGETHIGIEASEMKEFAESKEFKQAGKKLSKMRKKR